MTGAERNESEPARVTPRIYVASLADYNAGRLHGAWIDAEQEPAELEAAAGQMMAASREPFAEEWAIHDYEGFGPIRLSEFESFDTIATLGAGIAQHGPAFAAWANSLDRSEWDQLDEFEDHFRGRWDTAEDFAQELLEGSDESWREAIPEGLRPYVDFDLAAFTRDLSYDLTIEPSDDGGVWIFDR
jgi:antirestriction protein